MCGGVGGVSRKNNDSGKKNSIKQKKEIQNQFSTGLKTCSFKGFVILWFWRGLEWTSSNTQAEFSVAWGVKLKGIIKMYNI